AHALVGAPRREDDHVVRDAVAEPALSDRLQHAHLSTLLLDGCVRRELLRDAVVHRDPLSQAVEGDVAVVVARAPRGAGSDVYGHGSGSYLVVGLPVYRSAQQAAAKGRPVAVGLHGDAPDVLAVGTLRVARLELPGLALGALGALVALRPDACAAGARRAVVLDRLLDQRPQLFGGRPGPGFAPGAGARPGGAIRLHRGRDHLGGGVLTVGSVGPVGPVLAVASAVRADLHDGGDDVGERGRLAAPAVHRAVVIRAVTDLLVGGAGAALALLALATLLTRRAGGARYRQARLSDGRRVDVLWRRRVGVRAG